MSDPAPPPAAPPEPPTVPPAVPSGRSRVRWLAAAVALLVPLIPIVIGLLLGASTGSHGGLAPAPARAAAAPPVRLPPVQPPADPAALNRLLPPGTGPLVALVGRRTAMRSRPGGRVIAVLARRTPFGSRQALWVRRVSGAWVGVVSVLAGNNRIGWIPAAAASLTRIGWEIGVDLGRRQVTVLDDGRLVRRFTVAIGAPGSPTPTGAFAVTDRLRTGDPSGPYGCCILALSAIAPHAIQGWTGGDRVAIHSTIETWTIGQPVSHGCLRLTLAEGRWLIDHVPLGTPAVVARGVPVLDRLSPFVLG